jgi:hypothetical protein
MQAKQERQAVRSSQGEAALARQAEQAVRHAQSERRRLRHLHDIVQRATDESEKVCVSVTLQSCSTQRTISRSNVCC